MTQPKLVERQSGTYVFGGSPNDIDVIRARRSVLPRTPSPRSDESICSDIRSRFDASSELDGAVIEVESVRGEVTLSGEVAHAGERDTAVKIAARVYGVTLVYDELRYAASKC